jgi:hypothetical protein
MPIFDPSIMNMTMIFVIGNVSTQLCGATFSSKGDMFLPNPKNDNAHGHYQVSLMTLMMMILALVRMPIVTVRWLI